MGWTNSFKLVIYKNRTSQHMTDQEIIDLHLEIINNTYPHLDQNGDHTRNHYLIQPVVTDDSITFQAVLNKQNILPITKAVAKWSGLDYKLTICDDWQSGYDGCYTFTRMKDWEAHDDFHKMMQEAEYELAHRPNPLIDNEEEEKEEAVTQDFDFELDP